jgi:hypothetical protein
MEKGRLFSFRILLVCAVLLAGRVPLQAGTTGKVAGRINDLKTGSPLPGANLVIEGTALGAAADADGRYVILNVPPGMHVLRVTMVGYRPVRIQGVGVSMDLTTTIDQALEPTVLEMGEGVTVIAERPLVRKDMTSSFTTVNSADIRNLPVESIGDVLELQAGLIRDGNAFHIRGGRTGEVAYWIDGVAATDVYDGGMGVSVENSAVEELQVISGTYNAEYGQAMSGIVNIVTREGGPKTTGQVKVYAGDYLSGADAYKVLTRVGPSGAATETNPLSGFNPAAAVEGNLGGPVPKAGGKVHYFLNGRFHSDEGYQFGRRWFTPQGLAGDSALVAMGRYRTVSGQGKLTWSLTPHLKLGYNLLWNRFGQDRSYSHLFKYNPDGTPGLHSDASTQIVTWNHVLSSRVFYEARITRFHRTFEQYVHENPEKRPRYRILEHTAAGDVLIDLDPETAEGKAELQRIRDANGSYSLVVDPSNGEGYVHPDSLKAPTGYSYYRSGMDMGHLVRRTAYWIGKLDFTAQATRIHQVKTGLELRLHELTLDRFDILPKLDGGEQAVPFQPWVPPLSSPYRDQYRRRPVELSAYLQDKMELNDMIVNAGLRFDYFDANSVAPSDPSDPDIYNPFKEEHIFRNAADSVEYTPDERRAFMQKKVDPKMRFSPRLGLAYPITERGAIHFSYGHFFQIPEFQYLYEVADFKLVRGGLSTVVGNADLKPQRTVMYEVGVQQELTAGVGVDFTLFYRDIRNWVGTSPVIKTANPITSYVTFENKDYSNVRGFSVTLEKRRSSNFSARLDYTLQVAEGTYSNPRDAFYAAQAQREPRLALIPLAWDQRQTLNATAGFNVGGWVLTFQGKYRTGRPYTPSVPKGELVGGAAVKDLQDNSSRLPTVMSLDVYLNRRFTFGRFECGLFVTVYNALDSRSATNVFTDTGSARYTTTIDPDEIPFLAGRVGTVQDYLRHPDWILAPRQVQLGMTIGF